MKYKLIAVITACTLGLVGCVAPPAEYADRITAGWRCVDKYGSDRIIRAWILRGSPNGVVETEGILKKAQYQQQGLSHRWNFEYNAAKKHYEASFIIDPDNDGKYIYFGGSKEKTAPSSFTECTRLDVR